jgi:hypothetical protein
VTPRRFWRSLLGHPRFWLVLVLWPVFVLLFVVVPLAICYCESPAVSGTQAVAIATALAALGIVAIITGRVYRGVREIRNKLFQGDYEGALDVARHNAVAGLSMGFESAFERLLEFDRRRAERVAASTRLIDRLMHESPLPILFGDLEESLIRFSRSLCALFGVGNDRFSLLAILLLPANQQFARLWETVASGEATHAEAVLTLHLPARSAARTLKVQLFAVQDDTGQIIYVLGFARPPDASPAPKPTERTEPSKFQRIQFEEENELPQE